MRLLPLLLLLVGCKSLPSCEQALRMRAAAELTIATVDRVCPMVPL